jgi:hypothetical protein
MEKPRFGGPHSMPEKEGIARSSHGSSFAVAVRAARVADILKPRTV